MKTITQPSDIEEFKAFKKKFSVFFGVISGVSALDMLSILAFQSGVIGWICAELNLFDAEVGRFGLLVALSGLLAFCLMTWIHRVSNAVMCKKYGRQRLLEMELFYHMGRKQRKFHWPVFRNLFVLNSKNTLKEINIPEAVAKVEHYLGIAKDGKGNCFAT